MSAPRELIRAEGFRRAGEAFAAALARINGDATDEQLADAA